VVEDNPLNRELLCDWLEAEGHEVWSANDLTAAMRSIEERPPHIVWLDVQLGDEDGLSARCLDAQAVKTLLHSRDCRDGACSSDGTKPFLQAGCNACVSND